MNTHMFTRVRFFFLSLLSARKNLLNLKSVCNSARTPNQKRNNKKIVFFARKTVIIERKILEKFPAKGERMVIHSSNNCIHIDISCNV